MNYVVLFLLLIIIVGIIIFITLEIMGLSTNSIAPNIPSPLFHTKEGLKLEGRQIGDSVKSLDLENCQNLCRYDKNCSWVTFDKKNEMCSKYGYREGLNDMSSVNIKTPLGFYVYEPSDMGLSTNEYKMLPSSSNSWCRFRCLLDPKCNAYQYRKDNKACYLYKGDKDCNMTTSFKRPCRWFDLRQNYCDCYKNK